MTSSEEESEEELHRIELSEPLEKNGKHLRVLDGPRKGALLYTRIKVRDSMRVLFSLQTFSFLTSLFADQRKGVSPERRLLDDC